MSTTYPDLQNTSFPEEIDNFPSFVNMTQADFTYVKQYQEALLRGDTVSAQIAFNNISDGSRKIINALRLNQLRDAILATERVYGRDIEGVIQQKQQVWENKINEFVYMGTFSPATKYEKNNMVTYTSIGVTNMYVNIYDGETPSGTYPTSTTYWRKLTMQGAKGDSAPETSFEFEWEADVSYNPNSIVVHENAWWIAIQSNQNEPPEDGSPYWKRILQITQSKYPIQPTEPTRQSVGELWFETF